MKSLKIAVLTPLVILATACANNSSGGGAAAPEMKAGDKPITKNAWCALADGQATGNQIYRYKLNADGTGTLGLYKASANGTRGTIIDEKDLAWASNDVSITLTLAGQSDTYVFKLDTAKNELHVSASVGSTDEAVYHSCQ